MPCMMAAHLNGLAGSVRFSALLTKSRRGSSVGHRYRQGPVQRVTERMKEWPGAGSVLNRTAWRADQGAQNLSGFWGVRAFAVYARVATFFLELRRKAAETNQTTRARSSSSSTITVS
jgi:hypothetical protein